MSACLAIALVLRLGAARAQPADAPPDPPPAPAAPAPTRATFASTEWEQWDVVVDGQTVCTTPCSGPLYPQQLVVLQSQESRPVLLELGGFPPGDYAVSARPLRNGRYAGGIVATTLAGMALAIGITFTAVGLGKDRDGLTTAGLITGAVGALVLPGGIYFIVTGAPSYTIDRASPGPVGATAGMGGAF